MAYTPLESQYNARVNDVMTNVARYIPLGMFFYGLAVHFQLIVGSPLYSWQVFIAIVTVLLIVGATQPSTFDQSPLRQAIYYILFLLFAMFVTGMESILLFWIPLSVTTILNFDKRSFVWSTCLLFIFCIADGVVRSSSNNYEVLFNNIVLAYV